MTTQLSTALDFSVLVVDDNADHASSLAELLSIFGYTTRVAYSGSDALTSVAESQPDVVLLDLKMPGMDGHELARRLKAQSFRRRPLLVALSAFGSDEDRARSAAAGIDLHLVKPADPSVLRGVMERFREFLAPPSATRPE